MLCQIAVDLWTSAVDHNQPDPKAMQQAYIVNDTRKVFMLNRLATQHDNKCLAAVRIDIGN
ncbi:Uncharacterised protein [Yersinia enterocolitica]|nr:Uncharacterised protein [Yersinia enterocolitica]